MPNAVTHNYFAHDVYKKLSAKNKRKIDKDTMFTFSQGPDVFYYQTRNAIVRNKTHNFGHLVHKSFSKKFILTYTANIIKFRLEKNKEATSSLYGFITHYILDSYTHPLITYSNSHTMMELLIDLYMLEKREKQDPKKVKLSNLLFTKTKYPIQVKNLLNNTFLDVYKEANMGTYYLSGLKDMKFSFKHLRYDPYGFKLKLYKSFKHILPNKYSKLVYLSYANVLRDKISCINYEHNEWHNPLIKTEVSTDSFFDLYNKGINESVKIISIINDILDGKKEIKELEYIISDNSYLTGVNWHLFK